MLQTSVSIFDSLQAVGAVIRRQLCMAYLHAPEASRRTTVLFYVGMVSPGSTQGDDVLELTKVEK